MSRFLMIILLCLSITQAKNLKMETLEWQQGESFLFFLQKNKIPLKIYHELDKEDKELTAEIAAGMKFQILKDIDTNQIEQALIPINQELQIQIYRNLEDKYAITFSPISYKVENKILTIKLSEGQTLYKDIIRHTKSAKLAGSIVKAYSNTIDYKYMRPGDNIAIIYTQKRRLGRLYGGFDIQAAMIEINRKPFYIFKHGDNDFYDENGRQLENYTFILPVGNVRISSPFNPGRFHPVLKKYRAHLGIDYAAPKGTPIKAAGTGRIIFKGEKGGYGNVIQVSHNNGYMTLYAHMSRFSRQTVGQMVKQGEVIGYVGSTGISTGPHLHFGMYKNNVAINPASVVRVVKEALTGASKTKFIANANILQGKLQTAVSEAKDPIPEVTFDNCICLYENECSCLKEATQEIE